MYQNIYDQNPKRFYTIKIDENNNNKQIEQKGIREHLLCNDCEVILNRFETYASETIYAKNYQNKATKKMASENFKRNIFLYEFENFDYKKFKLFLMSLCWRLVISKRFETISIGEHEEKLRKAILTENPLEYYQYGCLIQSILYKKGEFAGGFILNPFSTNLKGTDFLHILIDGFMYSFMISDTNKIPDISNNFVNKNGEMNIIGRLIWDGKDLFDKLRLAYNFYNDKIKKIK